MRVSRVQGWAREKAGRRVRERVSERSGELEGGVEDKVGVGVSRAGRQMADSIFLFFCGGALRVDG